MQTVALLFSGGMDSFIAYHYLTVKNIKVIPIYVHYGGKYCDKELRVAKKLIPETKIIENQFNLGSLESGEKAFLPNRNVYLISRATEFADTVIFAGLKDDNVGDKTPAFSDAMSKMLSLSMNRKITVDSPFWFLEKIDIIEWFLENIGKSHGIRTSQRLLKQTTSCYHIWKEHCGECPSCFRKACALYFNGIKVPFHNEDLVLEYYKNRIKYTKKRQEAIVKFAKNFNFRDL
jgi:7-cyano-7-deazaguanine synthase in queuosine biosynthesis